MSTRTRRTRTKAVKSFYITTINFWGKDTYRKEIISPRGMKITKTATKENIYSPPRLDKKIIYKKNNLFVGLFSRLNFFVNIFSTFFTFIINIFISMSNKVKNKIYQAKMRRCRKKNAHCLVTLFQMEEKGKNPNNEKKLFISKSISFKKNSFFIRKYWLFLILSIYLFVMNLYISPIFFSIYSLLFAFSMYLFPPKSMRIVGSYEYLHSFIAILIVLYGLYAIAFMNFMGALTKISFILDATLFPLVLSYVSLFLYSIYLSIEDVYQDINTKNYFVLQNYWRD